LLDMVGGESFGPGMAQHSKKVVFRFIARAAGVGAGLFVLIQAFFEHGSPNLIHSKVLDRAAFALAGAIVGGVVGVGVWGIPLLLKINIGRTNDAQIGSLVCGTLFVVPVTLLGGDYDFIFGSLLFGAVFGSLPGLVARPRGKKVSCVPSSVRN